MFVPLLVGVVALAAFPFIELRSPHPLVPPILFRSRTFSVLNISTFVLYGALGVVFFFVVYQLQVVAGWSAIQAGSTLLPATILMLVGSASSGRICPPDRSQAAAGRRSAPRRRRGAVAEPASTRDATWWTVLPGALVFGLGLVTFVAPLTATVMSSADPDHVNTASGVNNAVARTGGLAAVAAVPLAAGLAAAQSNIEISDAYRTGMLITATLAVIAAVIDLIGLPGRLRPAATSRPLHCALDGAPLQADPNRCPPVGAGPVEARREPNGADAPTGIGQPGMTGQSAEALGDRDRDRAALVVDGVTESTRPGLRALQHESGQPGREVDGRYHGLLLVGDRLAVRFTRGRTSSGVTSGFSVVSAAFQSVQSFLKAAALVMRPLADAESGYVGWMIGTIGTVLTLPVGSLATQSSTAPWRVLRASRSRRGRCSRPRR